MSVQASVHGYTPLSDSELKKVERLMKAHAPELRVQVVSQLREQERNLLLQRAHADGLNKSGSQMLYELAETMEQLEDKAREWDDHECETND